MSDTVITLTDTTFEHEVLDSELPVLVEFWAQWCPPCHMIAPVLDQVAAERAGTLRVAKLDVDANPATQRDYRVMAMPTLMLFRAGKPIRTVVGARSKARLDTELDEALSPATAR